MKLSKSTTILINVALVLLIAILAKSFISAPQKVNAAQQNANAEPKKEYFIKSTDPDKGTQKVLSEQAQQGWKFVYALYRNDAADVILIMER
jgi:biopolymer transport protein ExbD